MRSAVFALALILPAGCDLTAVDLPFEGGETSTGMCRLVANGYGPSGPAPLDAEVVADGLEVPWDVAFLPNGDLLVTERAGTLRRITDGEVLDEPVLSIKAADTAEGGLLGLVLHPAFEENRFFYVYVTREEAGQAQNRVERWRLAEDGAGAEFDEVIIDDIPAARFHDGGRLHFGPDGMLYAATGDARSPELAQDRSSLAGKILRVAPDGAIPGDNPFEGSPVYVLGVRNTQAFDFFDDFEISGALAIADHGPSGEMFRTGGDEVSVARPGDNLGWPDIFQCEQAEGLVSPVLAFDQAVPPGGGAFYAGDELPALRGRFLVGSLGARHLHVVEFDEDKELLDHAVYLQDELGRIRDVVVGPDGDVYLTTSNCDGRGSCPDEGDAIVRLTGG